MKILINASPRSKKSSSESFIKRIRYIDDKEYYLYKDEFSLVDFSLSDTIVIACPLYVDTIPSKLVEFMEYIRDNKIDLTNKNIYVISNCGFLESEQNDISVETIKNFCDNNNAKYMGCFKIGSGSILGIDNYKFFNKLLSISFYYKMHKFKNSINTHKFIELKTRIHPVCKWMYIRCANKGWDRQREGNNW